MINATSVDFAALWRSYKAHDRYGRVDAEVDLAFWENAAPDYNRTHPVYPNVLAAFLYPFWLPTLPQSPMMGRLMRLTRR